MVTTRSSAQIVPIRHAARSQSAPSLVACATPAQPTPEALAKAAEAKARRAARKAARAAAPRPERDSAYDRFSLTDLRQLRTELSNDETRVSYWRRIIQARLDVMRSELPEHDPITDLTRVLTDAQTSRRRLAVLSVHPADDVPPLPDLAEVWSRQAERGDATAVARLVRDLTQAEKELSAFRTELHRRIDLLTAELIARYREQPLLALQILPTDPLHRRTSS